MKNAIAFILSYQKQCSDAAIIANNRFDITTNHKQHAVRQYCVGADVCQAREGLSHIGSRELLLFKASMLFTLFNPHFTSPAARLWCDFSVGQGKSWGCERITAKYLQTPKPQQRA